MRETNPELRISPELEGVIMRTLSKAPADRFGSMSELMSALLATPEGSVFGRPSITNARFSSIPAPADGTPTAAQFGAAVGSLPPPPSVPTALSPGNTAALGTPGAAAARTKQPTSSVAGQSATVAPGGSPSTGLIVGSLGAVFLVLGVGGYFVSTKVLGASDPPPAAAATSLAAEPTPTPAAPPAPSASSETTVAPVTAPPTEVRLHVESEPSGATVTRDGFQVCESTPCDISVKRNEGVELEGKKGTMRGSMKLMPQSDQTVTLSLTALVARPKPKPAEEMCETFVGELKVLRPCKK